MKTKRIPPFAAVLLIAVSLPFSAFAAEATPAALAPPSLTQLSFLTGLWRGTSGNGVTAEELISTPEGGVMLSAGREFKNGRCIFFDLVVFTEKDGAIALIPHPNGKRSPRTFPLVTLDGSGTTTPRAVFENREHDFPQTFTYELTAPDRLRITLVGEQKGRPAREIYELARAK